jgi:CBS-domain-containing membrane protein
MLELDRRFTTRKARYVFQTCLATLCILAVLVILDFIANAAVVVALGASTFTVFAAPQAKLARPRYLIGGYVVGLLVGTVFFWLSRALPVPEISFLPSFPYLVYGAPAVGAAMFVMVITNTEHPPAASIALGLVLNEWSYMAVVVALTGIVVLSVLKWLLRRQLINLI